MAVIGLLSATVWLLQDGQRLVRPLMSQFSGTPQPGSLRVNINTATTRELESVPGLGPTLSALVVAGRPYNTVEELTRVRGIGPRTVDSIRPFVKVEGETEKLSKK